MIEFKIKDPISHAGQTFLPGDETRLKGSPGFTDEVLGKHLHSLTPLHDTDEWYRGPSKDVLHKNGLHTVRQVRAALQDRSVEKLQGLGEMKELKKTLETTEENE